MWAKNTWFALPQFDSNGQQNEMSPSVRVSKLLDTWMPWKRCPFIRANGDDAQIILRYA
jgi:hypothetical protein